MLDVYGYHLNLRLDFSLLDIFYAQGLCFCWHICQNKERSRYSSEVEHTLGKGGAESSILSSGTIACLTADPMAIPLKSAFYKACGGEDV